MIRGIYDEERLILILRGHANYAPRGEDIVCAGVSALAFAYADHLGNCEKGENGMVLRANNNDKTEKAVFKMTVNGLKMIARTYPENFLITKGRLYDL